MASSSPSMDVEKELQCPICMEFLTDPGTLDCGHNFCKACITQYCETWEDLGDLECPLCKAKVNKGSFRPNWQLASIVEKMKYLSFKLEKDEVCTRHKEKLNLFCIDDKQLVCVGCERSLTHQSHTILLLEDAVMECMDQLYSCLEILKMERKRILENKAETEEKSKHLLGQIEEKKTRTAAVFNQLHQFLEEQNMLLLSQLEELEKDVETRREEHMARLVEKLASLESLIQEMEMKCQQPASELLQDIRRTLQSYEEEEVFGDPVAFPLELTYRIRGFRDINPILEDVMEQFPENVTLDPGTAHPQLILSGDLKSMRVGDKRQALPNDPERFDCWPCVLGLEGFTAQRHFWEVTVGRNGGWAVGVARRSVKRKCNFAFSPEEGVWAVGNWGGQYRVLNSPDYPPLSLSQELKRIRVTLNCAEMKVVFSDADTGVHIYTHSGAAFRREIVFPFFYVCEKAHLKLSP